MDDTVSAVLSASTSGDVHAELLKSFRAWLRNSLKRVRLPITVMSVGATGIEGFSNEQKVFWSESKVSVNNFKMPKMDVKDSNWKEIFSKSQ